MLVKDRQILATGYNGSMPGAPHLPIRPCPTAALTATAGPSKFPNADKYNFCRASHAEANAIAQAARHGVAIKGASLYVTLEPCYVCIKLLATAQIDKVYYELGYESERFVPGRLLAPGRPLNKRDSGRARTGCPLTR